MAQYPAPAYGPATVTKEKQIPKGAYASEAQKSREPSSFLFIL